MNKYNALEQENRRLRTAVEELSILNDIATAISSTQSLEQIVDLIVQKCVKHLKVEQGAVMLLDEKNRDKPFRTMVRKLDTKVNPLPFRLDTHLTGWMLKNKQALLINDFLQDQRFKFVIEEDFPIRSLLSVPLFLKGKMIGVITVFNKQSEAGFTSDDQRLLAIISAQSAQVIENARLYLEEQNLIRMQEEMRLAQDIQLNLLPFSPPKLPGYQIAGKSISAKEVGGDYFDYIPVDEKRFAFCLADVSGKGMPAALLMANLQATLRGQTLLVDSCSECVSQSNTLLHRSTDSKKFATLFYGIINSETNELFYCNAGHDNPFLVSEEQKIRRLKEGGIVIGFVPLFEYSEDVIKLNPGDLLVIYSDGISEAMNDQEEEFGESRLEEVIKINQNENPDDLIEKIIQAVQKHCGDQPQMDDMTLLVIKHEI